MFLVALRIVFRMVTKKLKLYKIRLKNNLIYLHKKEKEKHAYIYMKYYNFLILTKRKRKKKID